MPLSCQVKIHGKLNYMNLSKTDQLNYRDNIESQRIENTAIARVKAEGLAEGLAKGLLKAKEENYKRDLDTIEYFLDDKDNTFIFRYLKRKGYTQDEAHNMIQEVHTRKNN